MEGFTALDVEKHQSRHFGGVRCTCGGEPHTMQCPKSLNAKLELPAPAITSKRALKRHREPNQTEAELLQIYEARVRRGEAYSVGFEEITLRWADMEYTPDLHVCEPFDSRIVTVTTELVPMIHVFIEIKGGHKWEDSIIKWKAFAKGKPFPWARFELYQKEGGQWHRLG